MRLNILLASISLLHALSPVSATTYYPAAHPFIERKKHEHLVPRPNNHTLHFTANDESAFLHIPQLRHPTVNLLHSDHISGITCSQTEARVEFGSAEAHSMARQHWKMESPLTLIHHHDECGDAKATGHHGFVVVQEILEPPSASAPNLHILQFRINHSTFTGVVASGTETTLSVGKLEGTASGSKPAPPEYDDYRNSASTTTIPPQISKVTSMLRSPLRLTATPTISSMALASRSIATVANPVVTAAPSLEKRKNHLKDIGNAFKKAWGDVTSEADHVKDSITSVAEHDVATNVVSVAKSDVATNVVSEATGIATTLTSAAREVATAATSIEVQAGKDVEETVGQLIQAVAGGNIDKKFSFNAHPKNTQSPWDRPGYFVELISTESMKVWCVECGLKGSFEMKFNMKLTSERINSISFTLVGEMQIGVQLGFIANDLEIHNTFPIPLFDRRLSEELGLPYIALPGILDAVELQLVLKIDLVYTGSILVGTTFEWNDIHVEFDSSDLDHTNVGGIMPKVKTVKQIETEPLTAAIEVYQRSAIGVEFDVGGGLKMPLPYAGTEVYFEAGFHVDAKEPANNEVCRNGLYLDGYPFARVGAGFDITDDQTKASDGLHFGKNFTWNGESVFNYCRKDNHKLLGSTMGGHELGAGNRLHSGNMQSGASGLGRTEQAMDGPTTSGVQSAQGAPVMDGEAEAAEYGQSAHAEACAQAAPGTPCIPAAAVADTQFGKMQDGQAAGVQASRQFVPGSANAQGAPVSNAQIEGMQYGQAGGVKPYRQEVPGPPSVQAAPVAQGQAGLPGEYSQVSSEPNRLALPGVSNV